MGRSSAASAMLIRVGEPVVTSTNQGSATNVIALPVLETASAVRSAGRVRFLTVAKI
jgi:hypothetical protein